MNVGRWWQRAIVAVACLAGLAGLATPCRAQSPVFTIVAPDITLPPGAPEGSDTMLLRADRLTTANIAKNPEAVQDVGVPRPPVVDVEFDLRPLDQTDASRRWMLTAKVKNLPNNVTQKRYVGFQFDGQQITLAYTLSNKNTASFGWSVKGPPGEFSLVQGEPVEIGIAVQGVPATKVRLLQATLLEQSRKLPVAGGWMLCREKLSAANKTGADTDIALAAHSSQRLWLYPNPGAELVGKYVGNVTIGAAEKAEGEPISVTLYATSFWACSRSCWA
jgi:hypothetical protein